MSISGVVVYARPEAIEKVQAQLISQEGVEVHAVGEKGQFVVTVEQPSDQAMADTVLGLQNMTGVLSAAMVYHNFDTDEELTEEMTQ